MNLCTRCQEAMANPVEHEFCKVVPTGDSRPFVNRLFQPVRERRQPNFRAIKQLVPLTYTPRQEPDLVQRPLRAERYAPPEAHPPEQHHSDSVYLDAEEDGIVARNRRFVEDM